MSYFLDRLNFLKPAGEPFADGHGVAKAQRGTRRVFEPSASDGAPINVPEYRGWVTP